MHQSMLGILRVGVDVGPNSLLLLEGALFGSSPLHVAWDVVGPLIL